MSSSEISFDSKACLKMNQVSDSSIKLITDFTISQHQMDTTSSTSKEWHFIDWNDVESTGPYQAFVNSANASQLLLRNSSAVSHNLDSNAAQERIAPNPSEPSAPSLNLSGLDLQQRLLNLQPKPGTFEAHREQPKWGSSFPPAAYYITPPPYTPEISLASPSTLFHEQKMPTELFENSGYETGPQELIHSTPSVLSPHVEDYYSSQVEAESQDLAFLDAQHNKEPPYAELLYKCLLDAPGNQMILKDIYEWFRTNTDKTNNPDVKGWMNSIRHNLSMNQGFEKVEQTSVEDGRRGYVWRLSERALQEGVQSTTRYRKKAPSGKQSTNKNRRNTLAGINRIIKPRFERSLRIQIDSIDEDPDVEYHPDLHNDDDQEDTIQSPGSFTVASPSTPRGFVALPSGMSSPRINSMHSSPDWVPYRTSSPFSPTMDIPRSDPSSGGTRYFDATLSSNQTLLSPSFLSTDHEGMQKNDGPMSIFGHSCVNDHWDGPHQAAEDSNSTSEPLHPIDRAFSTAGSGMFSLTHLDNYFSLIYSDAGDGSMIPFLGEA